jgi:hypothetical protein
LKFTTGAAARLADAALVTAPPVAAQPVSNAAARMTSAPNPFADRCEIAFMTNPPEPVLDDRDAS